jgi:glutathione reductase (NADPH)
MAQYDYDLFVIGGGSGGVRAARVAAALGKRVALAEEFRFGGTCVIRGCVPKKLYVYASQFPEHFEDAAGYGWTVGEAKFDWKALVANKEREISRLEAIYKRNVEGSGGETIHSRAELVDSHTIRIVDENRTVTADQILIATGGRAAVHPALPGHEHCIYSNEVFDLPELPKAIMIEGGGYIAVEFANIFHGLGVDTTLVYRGKEILSRFDMDLRRTLHETMEQKGIKILLHSVSQDVSKRGDGRLDVTLNTGQMLTVDQVLLAIGRTPNTENLGLEAAGVEMDKQGAIVVDRYSRTSADNIWAVGDVTNRVQLTPVAAEELVTMYKPTYLRRAS